MIKLMFGIMAMALSALGAFGSTAGDEIALIKGNKTRYQILISAQAHPTEIFAAEELQKYLKKMTNVELPILKTDEANIKGNFVFVGNSPMLKGLGIVGEDIDPKDNEDRITNDDFIIKTLKDNLVLVGNDQRGTLYSVYHFLELQGIRFFEPGPKGELVPEKKEIAFAGLDIKKHPRFKYRGITTQIRRRSEIIGKMTNAAYIDYIDWMAKNKENWIIYSVSYCPISEFPKKEAREVYQEIKKRSMLHAVAQCHMWANVPSGTYVPLQYRGRSNGERKSDVVRYNPCYSSKEVYKDPWGTYEGAEDFEAKKILQMVKTYVRNGVVGEDVVIMNLPSDGNGPFCGCEECSKEKSGKTAADWFMELTIKSAREIAKKYPAATVGYYAFTSIAFPPESIFPEKEDLNLSIMYGIDGETRDIVPDKKYKTYEELYGPVVDSWVKWVKDSKLKLDLCSTGELFRYFKDSFEPKSIQMKMSDFDYLEGKGIQGADAWEITSAPFFPTSQNMRLWAKLYWDKIDLEKELKDFFEDYYGDQSEKVREIFTKLDNNIALAPPMATDIYWAPYKANDIKEIYNLRDEVLKLVKEEGRGDVRWHLNKLYLYLDYIILDHKAESLRKEGKEKEAFEVNVRQVELFTEKSEYFDPLVDLSHNYWITTALLYPKIEKSRGREVEYVKGLKEYLEAKEGKEVLICGPFPHAGTAPDAKEPAFDIDFLKEQGGEEKIEPKEGMEHTNAIGKVKWQKVKFAGMVDFLKVFKPKENVVGYAFYHITSPKEQEAKLSIGSDDGYKVWVNHKYVGGLRVFRGAARRQNEHNIHLKSGENLILVKVEQDVGGHCFYLEIDDQDGKMLFQQ